MVSGVNVLAGPHLCAPQALVFSFYSRRLAFPPQLSLLVFSLVGRHAAEACWTLCWGVGGRRGWDVPRLEF